MHWLHRKNQERQAQLVNEIDNINEQARIAAKLDEKSPLPSWNYTATRTLNGKTRVFVYGTLKKGYGNHGLLENQKFLCNAKIYNWSMRHLGAFPSIHRDHVYNYQNNGVPVVHGEAYEVDEQCLAAMDRLEGVPTFYFRTTVSMGQAGWAEVYAQQEPQQKWNWIKSGIWSGSLSPVTSIIPGQKSFSGNHSATGSGRVWDRETNKWTNADGSAWKEPEKAAEPVRYDPKVIMWGTAKEAPVAPGTPELEELTTEQAQQHFIDTDAYPVCL